MFLLSVCKTAKSALAVGFLIFAMFGSVTGSCSGIFAAHTRKANDYFQGGLGRATTTAKRLTGAGFARLGRRYCPNRSTQYCCQQETGPYFYPINSACDVASRSSAESYHSIQIQAKMSAAASIPASIMGDPIYRKDDAVRALLHIMLLIAQEEAAHTGDSARDAGVVTISLTDIAVHLRWHRSRVARAVAALVKADAVRTTAVPGGTRIKCLWYAPTPDQKRTEPKKMAPPAPKRTIEERIGRLTAACKAVCDADPARLPEPLRKEFHAYWTEQNDRGVMRFEKQPFFDHARRMDTWRRNAEVKGFKASAQPDPGAGGKWNPRA